MLMLAGLGDVCDPTDPSYNEAACSACGGSPGISSCTPTAPQTTLEIGTGTVTPVSTSSSSGSGAGYNVNTAYGTSAQGIVAAPGTPGMPTTSAAAGMTFLNLGIPTWAYYAAGGVLGLGILLLVGNKLRGQRALRGTDKERIRIHYFAVPNENTKRGGWMPVYEINGKLHGDTYGKGFDQDEALERAEERASEEAKRYRGDWDVTVDRKWTHLRAQ
jgi:hypothetical protein